MSGEQSILLATDGSESAEAATRMAIELAQATGDRLVVVTAWRELRGDFGVPLTGVFPDVEEIERDHARQVAENAAATARAAGVEAEVVLRHGPARREIAAVAHELKPRLLVLGSQGWGAIERSLFGSVSTSVVHHAGCPVLVVPDPAAVAGG